MILLISCSLCLKLKLSLITNTWLANFHNYLSAHIGCKWNVVVFASLYQAFHSEFLYLQLLTQIVVKCSRDFAFLLMGIVSLWVRTLDGRRLSFESGDIKHAWTIFIDANGFFFLIRVVISMIKYYFRLIPMQNRALKIFFNIIILISWSVNLLLKNYCLF